MLATEGLIEERGGKCYSRIVDLEAAAKMFNVKRSKAGRRGRGPHLGTSSTRVGLGVV